jgi:hypothetical protein
MLPTRTQEERDVLQQLEARTQRCTPGSLNTAGDSESRVGAVGSDHATLDYATCTCLGELASS